MDLEHAVGVHGHWRVEFRAAIANQEPLDAKSIGSADACDLGEWLLGEARVKYGTTESYREAVAAHEEFHREAGKVAKAVNDGRFGEADRMMGVGTPYLASSMRVGVAIMNLKREAGL